jgi:hypothetical protein
VVPFVSSRGKTSYEYRDYFRDDNENPFQWFQQRLNRDIKEHSRVKHAKERLNQKVNNISRKDNTLHKFLACSQCPINMVLHFVVIEFRSVFCTVLRVRGNIR